MKKCNLVFFSLFLALTWLFADTGGMEEIKIKGFYLDMSKDEVKQIAEGLKTQQIAKFISVMNERFRTSVKLDNDFSSMGNKIDIFYDAKGNVNDITFQTKTIDILFDASQLDAEQFMKNFVKEFKIPQMKFKDQGIVKLWIYQNKKLNLKISIDNHKNLRLQRIKK